MGIAYANFSGSCTLVTTVLSVFMINFSCLITLSIPMENLTIGRPRCIIKRLEFLKCTENVRNKNNYFLKKSKRSFYRFLKTKKSYIQISFDFTLQCIKKEEKRSMASIRT